MKIEALGQAALVAAKPGDFGVELSVIWKTLSGMGKAALARLPHMIIALLVFLVFVLVSRIAKGAILSAGERTRMSSGLVHLLSRLSGAFIIALGLSVAAVIVFPFSIERAREVILGVLAGLEGVHKEPEPLVYVSELAPSSVNFTVYFWVDSAQASALRVSDAVATGAKLALDAAQIDMPYPHTVVLFHDMTGTRPGERVGPGSEVRPFEAGRAEVGAKGGR